MIRLGSEELPEVEKLVGEWSQDDQSLWKTPTDMHEENMYLRKEPGYMVMMEHFSKAAVGATKFNKVSKSVLLSTYMDPALEAFIVLTYINNYNKWICEANASQTTPPRDATTTISDVTTDSVPTRWTENGRGSGKDKGWSDTAKKIYNLIEELIILQRKEPDPEDEQLKQFEENLMSKFIGTSSVAPEELGHERVVGGLKRALEDEECMRGRTRLRVAVL